MKTSPFPLAYTDHDGALRTVRGCTGTVDDLGRHWIWCESLGRNLVYKTKGRENSLLAAIDGLLLTVQLRDAEILALQRVVSLAEKFAAEVRGAEE